ncbi:DMT family transporter [Coxiella burnetii]|uniref:Transporter, drug/metabolite exporter family n=2 Tax=Coxiella burnetii TaxID=777 RepID=Q83C01_COXBU|nr:DMT family transporter [Coxiella burnetii]NP_820325.1 drug/metabolite exporter family transporter [Coxiella burnetii RSA 493]AAO90839.1 transporter, drug/metabolite exporter family [Coxiella burnetii RSA 493]ABS77611.1 transporter, drug/metabolite exporter family [Coxiella burnetii Dugway 5J108-111]ACJ18075.1 transporter, drug/metabolite exporter family [Coxiella burnetii CbuG_Q212]AML48799.1 hypothetical protein AUR58_06140 [Coxiella burnetii]AML54763.1 hypothetical protein AYM38_05435 [C
MKLSVRAHLALFFITLLWGLTFPLIKDALGSISPSLFVVLRTSVASLILLPVIFLQRKKTTFTMIKWTLVLGFFQSATYVFQSIGLESISSADSAFITALSVVVVPFLALIFLKSKPRWFDFVTALLCLGGIFILTGANIFNMKGGDFWTLGCAVAYALYIVTLQAFSKKLKPEDTILALSYQILFSLIFPLLTAFYKTTASIFSWPVIIAVLFCAIFATGLVFYLQLRYQRYIPVSRAVLIYAFEPIFAALFGYLLNGEAIYLNTVIGGFLILVSFVLSELFPSKKSSQDNNPLSETYASESKS